MKRIVVFLLVLVLSLTVVTAAAEDEYISLEEYEPKVKKLTIQTNNRVIPEGNYIDQWLEESLGVEIDWIILDGGELSTKINTLAASKNLPDIVCLSGTKNVLDYRMLLEDGLLVDLEPLIDKYGPNIKAYRTQEQLDALRESDGHIYALNNNINADTNMFCIRQDWLDNVGLALPTTVEEFADVLRAFKNDDPDRNGLDDTYGMYIYNATADRYNLFWASFDANPYQWVYGEDGTIVFGATKKEPLVQAIQYLQGLYAEGLINENFATATKNDFVETAKANKNGLTDMQLWWTGEKQRGEVCTQDEADWVVIPGLYSEEGVGYGYLTKNNPKVNRYTCITVDSKDPELCMLFLNFIADQDNYFKIRMGDEGVHYQWNEDHTLAITLGDYAKDPSILINMGITATYAMPFLARDAVPGLFGPREFEFYDMRLEQDPRFYAAVYGTIPEISNQQLDTGMQDYINQCINTMISTPDADVEEGVDTMVNELFAKYNLELQTELVNDYVNNK